MSGVARRFAHIEMLVRDLESCAWATGDRTVSDTEHVHRRAQKNRVRAELLAAIQEYADACSVSHPTTVPFYEFLPEIDTGWCS